MAVPDVFLGVVIFLFGAIVGSFLNMVIWRLPDRKPGVGVVRTLSEPARSYCPSCKHSLSALENIPLLSFLALRARCRWCQKPIGWRYFFVELLTAGLFLALFLHFRFWPTGADAVAQTVAYCLFFAALVAAFFIDLAKFIIPDELNTFALFVGLAWDAWGIAHHDPAHALLWGWLPRSVLGAMVCAGVFVFIQVLGYALFHKEAMGDGDVKLARAIGALLPLSQALVSFLLAIAAGAVLGGGMLAWQALRHNRSPGPEETYPPAPSLQGGGARQEGLTGEGEDEEPEPEAPPLGTILLCGLCYVTFFDLIVQFGAFLRIPAAVRLLGPLQEETAEEEDDFVVGPTHIPFGPYMVIGAALAVFMADTLIHAYLRWSGLG